MPELIPFRWPKEWKDSSKLDLLKNTPINCLVGEAPPPFPLGALKFVKLVKDGAPEGVALRDGVWPQVLPATKKDEADAGATGSAWVDSNAGVIRLAQTMEPGKPVWLNYAAPGGKEVTPLDRFTRAVVEPEVYGAHWIVTLSPPFIEGLDQGNQQAIGAWKRMVASMKLFEAKSVWRSWEPVTALTVVSSFEGDIGLISEEFVKLAPRRHLAHRIVRTADVPKASFEYQKAILYIETGPPEGAVRDKLLEFVQAGGLLIAPRGVVKTDPDETRIGYRIHRSGKGRIAMPPEAWWDPFLLVDEISVLVGRREDVVRVWNGGDMNSHFLATPKGDRGVVHLIQYASGRTQPVTIGLGKAYRSVRLRTVESETVVKPVKGELGIEIPVGEFSSYAAVELEA
jgi:hypothetical protein